MVDIKIKCVHVVKPSEPTLTGTFPLSEWDHAAGGGFVPYVYFYKGEGREGKDVVSVLKESLSRCLVHFYPTAGRVRRVAGGRLELMCNDEGVVLIEAETSSEMGEMGDFSESGKFKDLIYAIDYSKPVDELALMYAQVTRFRCGGFSLGLTMGHAVADGLGWLHLTSEWARFARGEPLERTPYLKRDVLGAREPPRPKQVEERKEEKPAQGPPPFKATTMINLTLSKKQVEKLKLTANIAIGEEIGPKRPYTRYEVLTTHIWRCACKARGHNGDELNGLGFGIDARFRIQPPLPPNYWGNAVLMVATKSKANDLISKPLGFGCGQVRNTIEKVTSEYIWSDIETLKGTEDLSVWKGFPSPVDGSYVHPNVMAISWLTLPILGQDFGWGTEIHMGTATHTHDGTAMIIPASAGDGSVVVAMCLEVAYIEKFKQHFYQDINVAEN